MKSISLKANYLGKVVVYAAVCLLAIGCQKSIDRQAANEANVAGKEPKSLKDFEQVNLVGNNDEYGAAHIDPTFINAWGIAFNGNGAVAWVNTEGGGYSGLYSQEGVQNTGRPFVNIPSPVSATGGHPTGIVLANIANQFTIPPGPNTTSTTPAAATFIFVGVDGVLSAWNGTYTSNAYRVFAHAGSAYTGMAIGNSGGSNFIYLANFAAGHIEVYNKDWAPVSSMSFTDPDLPAGYAPFNIQNVGGSLYVMYAKVDPEEHEEEKGPGLGYVDIYNTDGSLVKRFVSRGQLNAPWGVAQATAGFFGDDGQPAILIGNFGDGHIDGYNMDGEFLGQLRAHGEPIEIEGLWAITFPPGRTDRLYFAAGPDDEEDGLFGYIKKATE
jgi:uncharacterized protein (TIGR03118 family)